MLSEGWPSTVHTWGAVHLFPSPGEMLRLSPTPGKRSGLGNMKEAHELLNTRMCHVERVAVESVYEGSMEPLAPEVNFKLAFVFLFD